MRFKFLYIAIIVSLFSTHCTFDTDKAPDVSTWITPEAGTAVNLGNPLTLQVKPKSDYKIDSIVYFVDTMRVAVSKDTNKVVLNTDSLVLGSRAIIAKIYGGGAPEEVITNIVLKSTLVPKKLGYKVEQVFNHDTFSYTQGLEFHNGVFYESAGLKGESSLRKVDPSSGKVLQKIDIPAEIFAEGIAVVDDKIILLTWENNMGLVYDKISFQLLSKFPYQNSRQGWGLCFDGKKLYKSDGTNYIYFLNKSNYQEEGSIEVYDQNGPVNQLNELEFINGEIYANVYETSRIVIINPKNGQVTGEIDLSGLYPNANRTMKDEEGFVLNGIAWDSKGKRLFVTGKKWDKLFQIKLFPQSPAI